MVDLDSTSALTFKEGLRIAVITVCRELYKGNHSTEQIERLMTLKELLLLCIDDLSLD